MKTSKRTFLQAGMDRDVDERMLPQGLYRYASNVRVQSSEGDDGGAAKTVRGNTKLTTIGYTNAVTIGRFADSTNQLMYWCVTSDDRDAVIEYNAATKQTSKVLESSRPGVLNFDRLHLITGINKIINGDPSKDLLAITDDFNGLRRFNIARAKTYGLDGFTEEDISVIKAMPKFAPQIGLTYTSSSLENNIEQKLLVFAYRYIYIDNESSAASPYSYPAFSPNRFSLDYQTLENTGMVNAFNAVDIKFDTGGKNVSGVQLLVKATNSNVQYIVEKFDKKEMNWADNTTESFLFSNDKKLTALPSNELFRAFDNVPRLAKAQEFIGNRLVYANYLENYDIVDSNGNDITIDYQLSLKTLNLTAQELIITTGTVVEPDSKRQLAMDFLGKELTEGSALFFEVDLQTDNGGTYNNTFTFLLNRDYASAEELGTDEEFENFVEQVITSHWLANYSETPPANGSVTTTTSFVISNASGSLIRIAAPEILYTIDNSPDPDTSETVRWEFSPNATASLSEAGINSSLKSNRSYEVGLIYRDGPGRATTTLTTIKNTLYIPSSASTSKNKIQIQINHPPPAMADRFQFVIKQNKGNYETIFVTQFYIDGLFRWVKLEGANKDKVKEGDTLIVKSDLGGTVDELVTTRVIEIKNQEEDFIIGNTGDNDIPLIEQEGLYMKIKPQGFDMSLNNDNVFKTYTGNAKTKNGKPVIFLGKYDSLAGRFDEATQLHVDLPIPVGSRISVKFRNHESDGYDERYEKDFIVQADYSNFEVWWNTEVVDLGDQEENFDVTFVRNQSGSDNILAMRVEGQESGTQFERSKLDGQIDIIFSEGFVIFETQPLDSDVDIFYETSETFLIENGWHTGNVQDQNLAAPAVVELNVFNCFAMGNGAESYKIKDALNTNYLNFDLRPTTTSTEKYQSVRRLSDLTWSGNYLEESSLNGLGEFNLSLANFKDDIDKKYGSIQKLHTRDTDLVCFQEDKVHYVLFGKDLLSNADGSGNVTSTPMVLGQHVAFAGEYGISKNPESMAFNGTVIYFTDAKRGAVMRLSRDGMTEVQKYGMNNDFIELFKNSLYKKKAGGYDPYNDEYVIASENVDIFSENTVIPCSGSYTRNEFAGEVVFDMDFGTNIGTGRVAISKNSKPLTVSVDYDGTVTGRSLGSSIVDSINFAKGKSNPQRVTITVTAPEEGTDFVISGECIVPQTLTVITVVFGDDGDKNKTILNRYRFFNNSVVSPYANFDTTFVETGASIYNTRIGAEGSGSIPNPGSTIFLESYKGFTHTAKFGEDDRLGYLVSETLYSDAQIENLLTAANFGTVTETTYPSGDILNQTNFVFQRPANEKYLYLIYDYSLKNLPPVAIDDSVSLSKGESKTVDIRLNDTDPDFDPLIVIIVSQPTSGTVVVNANGSITYTHDDSLSLSDSFNYKVTDGKVESNTATVSLFIGVSCENGINASGNQGIYEATIVLGSETGQAGITYNAEGIPDRFQLEYDGVIVADSKYVGNSLNGDPPTYAGLIGTHTLSVFQYDGTTFNDTGTTRTITVGQSDIASGSAQEPTAGSGTLTFNKQFATPVSMKIIVTGPTGGTAWSMTGICPT